MSKVTQAAVKFAGSKTAAKLRNFFGIGPAFIPVDKADVVVKCAIVAAVVDAVIAGAVGVAVGAFFF